MEQVNTSPCRLLLSKSAICFILFFINSLGLTITATASTSFIPTNETDHQSLLAIKDMISGDPLNVFSSWNHSTHFCYWQGVTCSHRHHQRVTVLNLSSLALVGSLSPHIGNLTFLRMIDLSANSFHGKIPPEIGRLFRLRYLQLSNNSFQGEIPTKLTGCSELRVFSTIKNNMGGQIPTGMGSLSNLNILILAANNFTGTIPPSLGNLSSLRVLSLIFNNLQGSIPFQLGKLLKLEFLSLSSNNLSGMVPTPLYNISSIQYFAISFNQLQGTLPPDLGLTLPNLQGFYIEGNQIYGPIPSSLANATRLVQIDISRNSFTGPLTINPGALHDLEAFEAFSNLLGTDKNNDWVNFLTSFTNCSNLQLLDLAANQLTGLLPHSIANLSTNITWFTIDHNYISGSIPLGIGNLLNLQALYLSQNMLTGSIPDSIGKLTKLEKLGLETTNISGEIPSSIGNLTQLVILGLVSNVLEGSIPVSLGKVRDLHERKRPFSQRVIVLVVILTIVLLLMCLSATVYQNRRSKQQTPSTSTALPFQNLQVSYAELLQSTDGFSSANLLGQGRYGSVYKGILGSDGQIVAVKVFNLHEYGANKSFLAECESLRNIRHRNLVKIITSCSSIDFKGNDFKALVFEFMKNGSLESWIHPSLPEQEGCKNLNFVQRLNIAIDVASALDYLHHHCEAAIVHCDLKPSNILLDDDLCAHVGDFGLARILLATSATVTSSLQSSSIGIRGTIGFVAPEYGMGEEISTQGDMYSYGVLLLEMFTGKIPTDNMFTNSFSLHNYAKLHLPNQVMEIIDSRIIMDEDEAEQNSEDSISKLEVCLASILQIGVLCSVERPNERMNARDVLIELHKIRNVFLRG